VEKEVRIRNASAKTILMATKNDITGDFIVSKPHSKMFEENYDNIFGIKCLKCKFKQNLDKEPPPTLCQSCGAAL
jgi:hypothetical protein